MGYNRKKFFDGVKDHIDPSLNQSQVDGLEFLISSFENDPQWKDPRHIAYALATVFHETAGSFQPVVEGYYLAKTNPPDYSGKTKRVKDFQKTLRYYPYFGRGYVQLTWKTNYDKAGRAFGVDLVNKPELALQPNIAFKCLGGMFKGWYGGKLGTYINDKKTDYVQARRCVNILDKAGQIAGYAKSFEKILRSSAAASTAEGKADHPAGAAAGNPPQSGPANTIEPPPIDGNSVEQTVVESPEGTTVATTTTESGTVSLNAPEKDGATAASTKMVIAGVTVPPIIAGVLKAISDAVSQGYVSASEIGSFLMQFLRDNIKWVLVLFGLVIILLIVKKILKQISFWLQMLTHAIPGWNSIEVQPVPVEPKKGWLRRAWEWVL